MTTQVRSITDKPVVISCRRDQESSNRRLEDKEICMRTIVTERAGKDRVDLGPVELLEPLEQIYPGPILPEGVLERVELQER